MQTHYDIVVIGGGIQGAGVLQAAAAAGYSCLLLEQYPQPAAGTSSRSSKLIHGGLRYLETGEFKLVYECLRERRYLLRNAPHLVRLKPFIIPIYKETQRGSLLIRLGLILYTLLAGLQAATRFRSIPRSQWASLNGLRQIGLQQVYRYADAQTDDSLLTRAVLDSAVSLGAEARCNARFQNAIYENEQYTIQFLDTALGQTQRVSTTTLVNAAGPWINRVMYNIQPRPTMLDIEWVRGSHILLPGTIGERVYYLEAPQDRRAVFVMPWHDGIMIGTTEQVHSGDPADVQPSNEEIDYLLQVFNHYFPNYYSGKPATRSTITGSFAGLRVLPKDRRNPFKRTRETLFIYDRGDRPQLVAIYGGKLTSYRATADKVLQALAPQLPVRASKTDTRYLKLSATNMENISREAAKTQS
jgi:glycerol-3-phosphate dehydrogenase